MENVDVKKIMEEIKSKQAEKSLDNFTDSKDINQKIGQELQIKLKNPEYAKDIKKINSIGLKLSSGRTEVPTVEDEEKNLTYLNENHRMPDLHFQQPSKGILNLIIRPIRSRLVLEVSFIIERILSFQNNFNIQVIRFLNSFKRRIDNALANINYSLKKNEADNTENKKNIKEIYYPKLDINYKKLENLHRGPEKDIAQKNQIFLKFFESCQKVLDMGCGRGEFLEELRKKNITAYGIDIDKNMVQECKNKNLTVFQEDIIIHLLTLQNEALDGIFCDQVLEHLSKKDIMNVIRLSSQKIKTGKFAIFTTLNIKNLTTFVNSLYIDPTHITPLHPEMLKFLCQESGFSKVEFIFYSDYKEEEKLQKTSDEALNKNIDKLNELLFSSQDYAVVCTK